jgi:hypothetical protein
LRPGCAIAGLDRIVKRPPSNSTHLLNLDITCPGSSLLVSSSRLVLPRTRRCGTRRWGVRHGWKYLKLQGYGTGGTVPPESVCMCFLQGGIGDPGGGSLPDRSLKRFPATERHDRLDSRWHLEVQFNSQTPACDAGLRLSVRPSCSSTFGKKGATWLLLHCVGGPPLGWRNQKSLESAVGPRRCS